MIHKRRGPKFFMPDGWEEKIRKGICPVCNKENTRGYRCCSKECTVKFWKTEGVYWSTELKGMCFKRDNYICRKCGASNKALDEWQERFDKWLEPYYGKEPSELPEGITRSGHYRQWFSKEAGRLVTPAEIYTNKTGDKCPERICFEADHIVPIALGGDQYDLNNYQTLCERCHRKKTAREGRQFAQARRGQTTVTESLNNGKQKKLGERNV